MGIEAALSYLESHRSQFLDDLKAMVSFQSIADNDEHRNSVDNCAKYLMDRLEGAGVSTIQILNKGQTNGPPVIFATQKGSVSEAPTALIYGHYDVVGIENKLLWDSDPFTAEVRNGKIYGRGTSDDKGQLLTAIFAAECILKTVGDLPINIKFLFEGEEETTSQALERVLSERKYINILSSDAIFVSDDEWQRADSPAICIGDRGILDFEINITGPKFELHSGTFGGAVANPINVLVEMLRKFWDDDVRITLPHFYGKVANISNEDKEDLKHMPFDEEKYRSEIGVKALRGEKGYAALERIAFRPTFDIVGIWGGYSGAGPKSAIPPTAGAKVSMRLVANQDPHEVANTIEKFLGENCPDSVSMNVEFFSKSPPYLAQRDSAAIRCAATAIEETFGKKPILIRSGGSIPVISLLDKKLEAPVAMCGLGWPTDKPHSDNENFPLEQFYKGIEMYIRLFYEFANCGKK